MQTKEALVRIHTFPKPLMSCEVEYQPYQGRAKLLVTRDTVHKALFCQSVKKVAGPYLYNFSIVCILWDWDTDRIISLATQVLRIEEGCLLRNLTKEIVP